MSLIHSLRHSALAKVLALLVLTLLLCIPLSEIGALIHERSGSQAEAASELSNTYTGAQSIAGPFILIPWTEQWSETQRNSKGEVTGQVARSKARTRIVFPEQLKIEGALTPEARYRGLFKVLFYKLDATLGGQFATAFAPPASSERQSSFTMGTPVMAFSVDDVRGIEGLPELTVGGQPLKWAQGIPAAGGHAGAQQGIHAALPPALVKALGSGQSTEFRMTLRLVGHETLSIIPAAENTEAHLQSPWPHPSFGGRFLASERSVSEQGFDARWRVSSLVSSARSQLAQQWSADNGPVAELACGTADAACQAASAAAADGAHRTASAASGARASGEVDAFRVTLAQPVNVYFMAHRAAKYGALIIGLVLMGAFMFELFRQLRLHAVQYGLVGLSIALFFLLLVALSEKLAFWQAYAASAGASVLLLGLYFSAVLQGWRRGWGLAAFVAVLYGALYGLLASESNALLLGALLTFGMLAALMLMTRHIDWYALSSSRATPANP